MSAHMAPADLSPTATSGPSADVCLIVEGCYPYVQGGVAAWIDWLMRSQPDLSFSIVALWPRPGGLTPRYQLPPNAVQYQDLYLQDFGNRPRLPGDHRSAKRCYELMGSRRLKRSLHV